MTHYHDEYKIEVKKRVFSVEGYALMSSIPVFIFLITLIVIEITNPDICTTPRGGVTAGDH
jgi:hypothetical protein